VCIPLLAGTVNVDTIGVNAAVAAIANANAGALAANPVTRAIKIYLIVLGIIIIFGRMNDARALVRRINPFFLAFLVLAPLSSIWSFDSGVTIARYVSMAATVFAAFAFCLVGFHRQRLQSVLRPLFTVVVIGSLLYIAGWPDYALDVDGAGYHGLAGQKNPFGWQCAACTLLWMHAFFTRETSRFKALAGIAIGWSGLLLSRSSTSILATAFAGWLMWMLAGMPKPLRRYTPYIVTVFACLVVAYALAVLQLVPGLSTILLGPVMAITGKDMTFSNRSLIWDIIKEHAQYHPLLGTGFGAYWTGAVPESPSYVFFSRMYFWPSEAHNGYLDVYNDLGVVGLLVLMGFLVFFVRQALQLFRADRAQGILYLGLFFQQAVNNLSESLWFSPMGPLPSLIVTIATFMLARQLMELRSAPAPQGAAKPAARPRSFVALRGGVGARR
jgi:exopolysaccharide production protein ExoQ